MSRDVHRCNEVDGVGDGYYTHAMRENDGGFFLLIYRVSKNMKYYLPSTKIRRYHEMLDWGMGVDVWMCGCVDVWMCGLVMDIYKVVWMIPCRFT